MNVLKVVSAAQKRQFLMLPRTLYAKDYHQSDGTVRQFLDGTHPLSDDATITHYLLVQAKTPRGRMTLAYFPGGTTLYLGFFECPDDQAAAARLFETARAEAVRLGCATITGPVDVSFWIGYRFKLDGFDRVYFGEPQNKPYYPRLFETAGFRSSADYVSHYHRPLKGDEAELAKFKRRSQRAVDRGIRLVHPDYQAFDRCLEDIHGLLMELYRDFPAFHPLSLADFKAIYGGLRRITDPRFIVLAYDGDLPVGFFIAFPDYGNGLSSGSWFSRLRTLLAIRRRPGQIVLSYSGVKRGYEGLSGALYYPILCRIRELGLPAVSTLMKTGKVTAGFGREAEESTTHYRLYELTL